MGNGNTPHWTAGTLPLGSKNCYRFAIPAEALRGLEAWRLGGSEGLWGDERVTGRSGFFLLIVTFFKDYCFFPGLLMFQRTIGFLVDYRFFAWISGFSMDYWLFH